MRLAFHYTWAIIQNVALFLIVIPLSLLGIIVVPLALLFPNDSQKTQTYKTDGTNEWWLRTLPRWAKWWDNPYDGFLGDEFFRWAGRDIPFGWKNTSYIGQIWWGAFRNPLHYFKSFVISCDTRRCKFELLQGQLFVRDRPDAVGYQFQVAYRDDGMRFYRIYWVHQWPEVISFRLFGKGFDFKFSEPHAAIIELGHEFRQSHWSEDYGTRTYKYFKGFAFLPHPCKAI